MLRTGGTESILTHFPRRILRVILVSNVCLLLAQPRAWRGQPSSHACLHTSVRLCSTGQYCSSRHTSLRHTTSREAWRHPVWGWCMMATLLALSEPTRVLFPRGPSHLERELACSAFLNRYRTAVGSPWFASRTAHAWTIHTHTQTHTSRDIMCQRQATTQAHASHRWQHTTHPAWSAAGLKKGVQGDETSVTMWAGLAGCHCCVLSHTRVRRQHMVLSSVLWKA